MTREDASYSQDQGLASSGRGLTALKERSFAKVDAALDEALKETFPASDPVSITPQRK